MKFVRHILLGQLAWLTAIMVVIAGTPHPVCGCRPDSASSTPTPLPWDFSCACATTPAPIQNHPTGKTSSPHGGKASCCCPRKDGTSSQDSRRTGNAPNSCPDQQDCHKVPARVQVMASSAAPVTAAPDLAVVAAIPTAAAAPVPAGPALHDLGGIRPIPPPQDLIVLFEHFLN